MKYFNKISFWNRAPEAEESKASIKPYKTYNQVVQGLPSFALKKRLAKLNSQLALMDESDTTEGAQTTRKSISDKMQPILSELKNRNDL